MMAAPFAKDEKVKLAARSPTRSGAARKQSPKPNLDYAAAIGNAFPTASAKAPALQELLDASVAFAAVDPVERELVVDVTVLIKAAVATGHRTKRQLSSARWFLAAADPDEKVRDTLVGEFDPAEDEARKYHAAGYTIVASRSVRNRVVPRALELASETMRGQPTFDQRHMLFALLEQPTRKWPPIGRPVTGDLLAAARRHIVEMIGKTPDKGEDMAAWAEALARLPDKEDRVGAQRDEPAAVDSLGRLAFATVLANRLVEVRDSQDAADEGDRAFLVHLDGPWGSGKSSVLNFLKSDLRRRNPAWLIVDFDAWREQKNEPAWWTLITKMVREVGPQLRGWRKLRFAAIWGFWNLRNKWGPVLLMLALIVSTILLWPKANVPKWEPKDFLALATAFGALAALARAVVFGSGTTAKALEELRSDPYTPVMSLFGRLVACARRPILIIIDNIDRCDGPYVVSLLENIQTMLRSEPISYLVAGDRKWIVASFEDRYEGFRGKMDMPGRPLGHLFLDKLFQLSVSIPRISPDRLSEYWRGLLLRPEARGAAAPDRSAKARELVGDEVRPERLQDVVERAADDPALQEAVRIEAAIKMASPAAGEVLESRYASYGPLLDPNPRAMKRLINAIGIAHSVCMLEGRSVNPDVLARWTILELRWPLLAEALAANRDWLDGGSPADPGLEALLVSPSVAAVLATGTDAALKRDSLDSLFGDNSDES